MDAQIDKLTAMLQALAPEVREAAEGRLGALLRGQDRGGADAGALERIRSADAEEILEIVEEEMGVR